jgi:hypothetical protein
MCGHEDLPLCLFITLLLYPYCPNVGAFYDEHWKRWKKAYILIIKYNEFHKTESSLRS